MKGIDGLKVGDWGVARELDDAFDSFGLVNLDHISDHPEAGAIGVEGNIVDPTTWQCTYFVLASERTAAGGWVVTFRRSQRSGLGSFFAQLSSWYPFSEKESPLTGP